MYGRREAFSVHQGLQEKGPVKVPREFVFMDRAAIGLGGVFLHLGAELNYHRLFNDTIAGSDLAEVAGAPARGLRRSRRAAARGVLGLRCRAGIKAGYLTHFRYPGESRDPGATDRSVGKGAFCAVPTVFVPWATKRRPKAPIIAQGGLCGIARGERAIKRASEGSGMHIDPNECHPAMDYAEHQKTYKLFLKLTVCDHRRRGRAHGVPLFVRRLTPPGRSRLMAASLRRFTFSLRHQLRTGASLLARRIA